MPSILHILTVFPFTNHLFSSNMIYLSKRGGEMYTPLRSPEGVVLVANQHER